MRVRVRVVLDARVDLHDVAAPPAHVQVVDDALLAVETVGALEHLEDMRAVLERAPVLRHVDGLGLGLGLGLG